VLALPASTSFLLAVPAGQLSSGEKAMMYNHSFTQNKSTTPPPPTKIQTPGE
jgi:hypothetical protein